MPEKVITLSNSRRLIGVKSTVNQIKNVNHIKSATAALMWPFASVLSFYCWCSRTGPDVGLQWNVCSKLQARAPAAADRPARRRGSSHAKYSVSHRMVIKPFLLLGLARRWVWWTVVRRPSEVYDTHRRTKLTAPETINRSIDMIGALQNLNGSRDLTTPFQG